MTIQNINSPPLLCVREQGVIIQGSGCTILVCYSLFHSQCVSQKELRALPVLGPSPCRPFWAGPSDVAAGGAPSVSLSPQHSLQNRLYYYRLHALYWFT